MIAFADTGAHPWAVMVVDFDACVAVAAVEAPWWFEHIASPALGDGNLMSFN